ncbi:uncharacterized protein LOC131020706 [Salvia miltiorrhiza]|uniref:uncharacterized protein LOC131020706 n=1 Tax=Salvia miltiorrhiza TaxID=226208 RepID=UPI0025ABFD13|nr:uncharacterized protein LOC131020706 [Salvia miltiorrhiza]
MATIRCGRGYFKMEKKKQTAGDNSKFDYFLFPISMANSLASTIIAPPSLRWPRRRPIFRPNYRRKLREFRFCAKNPTNDTSINTEKAEPENVLLKIAWYGSEFLGIAASLLRSPPESADSGADVELCADGLGKIDRAAVVERIKQDFDRSYFVTGNLTADAYEDECEFADPAGSFRGLSRFKRNCTNFGYLIERSNMKLMKWEDFEDKGIGHWRFSCVMSFPWKPILSATGFTEYFFDENSGKVCRHIEHWNVPKMTLLKQLLKPSIYNKSNPKT